MIGSLRLPPLALSAQSLRDPLTLGVIASLLLHGLLLAVKFAPPVPVKFAPSDSQIEIVLLNAQTEARPVKPEVLAQVDMEGGGDRDKGRAKSPLPADVRMSDGFDLREQRRRVQELEEQQRRLLALASGRSTVTTPRDAPSNRPRENSGADAQDGERAISRLQAQIDRQISDYNKRPRRLTYGINAVGVTYARYVEDWATKIERIGTERYPPEARGRIYDSMIITVEIDKHGNVVDVIVNKKSRYDVLNRAVRAIVYAGAPYERFPPEMAKEGDILQIVRTWNFTNDALATQATRSP
jgi:protein TonB